MSTGHPATAYRAFDRVVFPGKVPSRATFSTASVLCETRGFKDELMPAAVVRAVASAIAFGCAIPALIAAIGVYKLPGGHLRRGPKESRFVVSLLWLAVTRLREDGVPDSCPSERYAPFPVLRVPCSDSGERSDV
jgi:hypothetical protein